jgi:hypothetical protein
MMFPKRGKARAVARGRTTESELQRLCEDYLVARQITFIRVPDAMYRAVFGVPGIVPHIKAMIAQFVRGLPDITILRDDGTYQCIELKTATGKQSTGQKQFERRVAPGHYHIVRNFDEFQEVVENGI